jgi:hypothetical protein
MNEAHEERLRGRYRRWHCSSPNHQRESATIQIGMCAPVTGPAVESGGYAIKGAKLA